MTTSPKSKTGHEPEEGTRPIFMVSNRLPFTLVRGASGFSLNHSAGGLVSALEPVLETNGGTWVGWLGDELRGEEILEPEVTPYAIKPIPLNEREVDHYYHGFSNTTLWPLFHSMPDRTRFDREDWESYEHVNQRFAEATLEDSEDSDLIWVQDYHLMLTPSFIREQAPKSRIGFFLHIPFPPYDIFRLLPWDRELLLGLLACDLIGFHVIGYAQNFLDCVERRLGARVNRRDLLIHYGNRTIKVGVFPIGIDFDGFEEQASQARPAPDADHQRVILGIDRLDYTKGIPERIRAFERFLEQYPDFREKSVLLQVAVPSRSEVTEYQDLKAEIEQLVGEVNGRFSTASWSPIRYLYRSFSQDELSALYRDADVALVTPLRDGMNLVAKEFVACQVADPGVLILSRLAGASETMHEALRVNPYNLEKTAAAIHRALTMESFERNSRMTALRKRERIRNVGHWVGSYLAAARETHEAPSLPSHDELSEWFEAPLRHHRLALFLDYDGTLTPICEHPDKAILGEDMKTALFSCATRDDTDVTIVSGRSLEGICSMVKHPALTYAGNHGLEVTGSGIENFLHEDLIHYEERTQEIATELEKIATDGAWVENKGPTLTFHVRSVVPEQSIHLLSQAHEIITEAGYQARNAHEAVEARPPIGWDKGRAVLHVLRSRYGPSWSEDVRVIYVGDDETDEDAFRFLSGLALTFRVGNAANLVTAAKHPLPTVDAVRSILEWLGQREEPIPPPLSGN